MYLLAATGDVAAIFMVVVVVAREEWKGRRQRSSNRYCRIDRSEALSVQLCIFATDASSVQLGFPSRRRPKSFKYNDYTLAYRSSSCRTSKLDAQVLRVAPIALGWAECLFFLAYFILDASMEAKGPESLFRQSRKSLIREVVVVDVVSWVANVVWTEWISTSTATRENRYQGFAAAAAAPVSIASPSFYSESLVVMVEILSGPLVRRGCCCFFSMEGEYDAATNSYITTRCDFVAP